MVGTERRAAATGVAFLALVALGAPQAAAQSVTEFPVPTTTALDGITAGADGALWFGEHDAKIGRITTAGAVTEFSATGTLREPQRITAGPDGALWFTDVFSNAIGQITTAGAITEFPVPTAKSEVTDITVGADGALWFTESSKIAFKSRFDASISEFAVANTLGAPEGITATPDGRLWFATDSGIGRLNPTTVPVTFQSSEFSNMTDAADAFIITRGPDGALWFAQQAMIGRITLDGRITDEIPLPAGSNVFDITTGPDGALWFADQGGKLGRISTTKALTEFSLPTGSSPFGIVTGPDGALWFTDNGTNSIGRFSVPPAKSPLFSATLPASRSIQIGHTATAFATIINASANTIGDNCGIAPITSIPGTFTFQTTDPRTNVLTGAPNVGAQINPGQSQSFVVAFGTTTLPDSAQVPINVVLGYHCDGIDAAETIVGVNTILLTFDAGPVPDVIAIGLTPSNDGFAHTNGVGGTGLFATASSNVGVSGTLTARVRLSDTTLPVTATVCETNPGNGQCLAPPGPTVTTTINAGQNQTWSVFLQATGLVAADPAHNRAFFEFVDGSGVVRGSTSTAVTTQ